MRKTIAFVLVIFSGFFFFQCGQRQPSQTIQQIPEKSAEYVLDTLITKQIPLTIDGDSGTIHYHLCVKDWNKSVEWLLSVMQGSDTIYSMVSHDKWMDSLFNDNNFYSSDGGGYFANKKGWYLKGILQVHFDTLKMDDIERRDVFIDHSKKYFLTGFGIDTEDQLSNWKSFWEENKYKPLLMFGFYNAPECDVPVLIYNKKIRKIIPIYAP